MVSFRTKTIDTPPPVSDQLRFAREERGEALPDIARRINVSTDYLLALEQGTYQTLPGYVYAKSFLRSYANYLRLSVDRLLESFRQEYAVCTATTGTVVARDSQQLVERVGWLHLLATPNILRKVCIVLVGLLCVGYLGVKVRGVIEPPQLVLQEPSGDLITSDLQIAVGGTVEPGAQITINGQGVVPDEAGKFSETVMLQTGVNTIEVTAQKKHSKTIKVERSVVVVGKDSL